MDNNGQETFFIKPPMFWTCPVCGYAIANIEYEFARFNFECPGCETRKIMQFDPVMTLEELREIR